MSACTDHRALRRVCWSRMPASAPRTPRPGPSFRAPCPCSDHGRDGRSAVGAELGAREGFGAARAAELLLRDEGAAAVGAELPSGLLAPALAARDLRAAGRERGRGRARLRETPRHRVAHAHADRHLRAQGGDPSTDAVRGHPLPSAHDGLARGVALVAAGQLLDVARVLAELLIELKLTRLRVGRGARHADLSDLHLALGLRDLGVRGDEPLAIRVGEVDVELTDLENPYADIREVRRVGDERGGELARQRDRLQQALALVLAELPERGLDAVHEDALDPPEHLVVAPAGGLARVADDEADRVHDDHAHLAEDPGLHLLVFLRIEDVTDGAAERHAADGRGLDEEDLRDEDLPARVVGHQLVEKRDVLRVQRDATGRDHADHAPVLEEHRALVAVDGELRVGGDVLIGVLVDDQGLLVVRSRDHHLAHAVAYEVEHSHGSLLSGVGADLARQATRIRPRAGEPLPLRPWPRLSCAIVQPPVPAEALSALARRAIDPASPPAMRQMAAKGAAPGL